jgi:hypothetical protein
MMTDPEIWLTAALAGLGGAAHCAAMCGPLTLALGAEPFAESLGPVSIAIRFNLGRLVAYGMAGGLAAGVVNSTVQATGLVLATEILRVTAAAMLALVGIGLLGLPGLTWLEQRLAPLWRAVRLATAPLTRVAMGAPRPWRPFFFGLLWLFIPCGLIWSMLLVAATRGSVATGALTMLAFGVGTTPAVLSLSIAGTRIAHWLKGPQTRRMLGIVLVLTALASAAAAVHHASMGTSSEHGNHHHMGS